MAPKPVGTPQPRTPDQPGPKRPDWWHPAPAVRSPMWSDDDFLNRYESWKMGTHLQTIAVAGTSCVVLISLVFAFVRDRPPSIDDWIPSILYLPVMVVLVIVVSLPVNLFAFHAMARSARRRRRDNPESFRTVVLPALDDTHGIPLRLMHLYRRVGLDPKKV